MSHVSGPNTAYERLRSGGNKDSSSGIMYPSHTNDRGSGGRECHASGDTVGGIVTKNRKQAINQIRNNTGRSCHAEGDSVQSYDDGQEKHFKIGKVKGHGVGHHFGHMGRDLNRTLTGRTNKVGKEIKNQKEKEMRKKIEKDAEPHKFGDGIRGDFKNLGKTIKHGFHDKITKPSKHGLDVAGSKMRKAADFVGDKAKESYKSTAKSAKKTGRAIREDWKDSGN